MPFEFGSSVVPPIPLESDKLGATIPNFALEDILGKVPIRFFRKASNPDTIFLAS